MKLVEVGFRVYYVGENAGSIKQPSIYHLKAMLPCADLHQSDSGALALTIRSRPFYENFPVQGPPPSPDPA
eukprot:5606183-Lingulodinium_polyedra.AAC.1